MALAPFETFDRYTLLGLLGEGGMGAVYRAHDPRLNREIALKVLRVTASEDPQGAARLVREARAAAALTDAHAVAVYDAGTFDGHPFIAMELIAGKTLRQYVGDPSVSIEMRIRWMIDIATALASAHEGGLVHRDIKPENVMVRDDGVLKVLDFGIARRIEPSELDTITQEGTFVGTPLYMAPEQLWGEAIDPRADQFAWGVVAYELLTGARPWAENATTFRAIAEILNHEPPPPSSRTAGIPQNVDDAISRALAKGPAQRFRTMRELVRALEGKSDEVASRRDREHATPPPPADVRTPDGLSRRLPSTRKAGNTARFAVLGGGVIAIALAATFAVRLGSPVRTTTEADAMPIAKAAAPLDAAAPLELRRAIAVLGFRDLRATHDEPWRSTAIAELLGAELAAGGHLRTVASDRVARTRVELGIDEHHPVDAETLARVRDNLAVDLVVTGSYLVLEGSPGRKLQLQVVLLDALSGATLTTVVETGTEADLFPLVARIARNLRGVIGAPEPAADQTSNVGATLPNDPVAARTYAEGLAAKNHFRDRDALALFTKVTQLEPSFALAHAQAATAMMAIGDDEGAKREAPRARDLAAPLPRAERLWIEALNHFVVREWLDAAKTYQALFTFYPDDIEYGLMQAQMLTKGGRPKEALAVIADLRKLPETLAADPRIDYEEARAAHVESEYALCLDASIRGEKKAEARGNRILLAMLAYPHGIALGNLGHGDEGLRVLENGKALARELGDLRTLGVLQSPIASAYTSRGELDRARAEVIDSRRTLLAIGNTYFAMSAWEQLGGLDVEKGELTLGRARMEEAIAYYRTTSSSHAVSGGLPSLAVVMGKQGDPSLAEPLAHEGVRISQSSGRKTAETSAELALGFLARVRGDLIEAKRHQERALEIARAATYDSGIARALHALGDTSRLFGDRVTAKKQLEEALALREKIGEKLRIPETRLALARVAIDEGRMADAEALARDAGTMAESEGAASTRGAALGVLARVLAQGGRVADANAAIAIATKLAPTDTAMHLELRIAEARVALAAGDSATARRLFDAVVRDANRIHHEDAALEARARLAAIDATLHPDAALGSLEDARNEAVRRGFIALAQELAPRDR